MASNFFDCICGRFATINMLDWVAGKREISCNCGRILKDNSILGFNLDTAHYAWRRFMREEVLRDFYDGTGVISNG